MTEQIEKIIETCLYKDSNKYKLYSDDAEMMFGNWKNFDIIIEKTEKIVKKLNENPDFFNYDTVDLLNMIK